MKDKFFCAWKRKVPNNCFKVDNFFEWIRSLSFVPFDVCEVTEDCFILEPLHSQSNILGYLDLEECTLLYVVITLTVYSYVNITREWLVECILKCWQTKEIRQGEKEK